MRTQGTGRKSIFPASFRSVLRPVIIRQVLGPKAGAVPAKWEPTDSSNAPEMCCLGCLQTQDATEHGGTVRDLSLHVPCPSRPGR